MKNLPIMLFAAGFGTRMKHLVHERPKPLINVGKTTLLDHAISMTQIEHIGTRVVNTHYKGQMIADHLDPTDIVISDESPEVLETGGGLKNALPLLGGSPVATLNTDAVWRGANPIQTLIDRWDDKMEALLLLVPQGNALGHSGLGDFEIDGAGRITRGAGEIYTGAQVIKTEGLKEIPEKAFSMNLYWDKIAERGGLFGTIYDGDWCDVGRPENITLAETLLER